MLKRWTLSSEAFCLKFNSMLCDVFYTEHAGSGSLFILMEEDLVFSRLCEFFPF